MEKFISIIKYVWLGIALFALATGIYYTAIGQWKDGVFFFVIVIAGAVMFRINLSRQKKFYSSNPNHNTTS
jgi:hypothetical protein